MVEHYGEFIRTKILEHGMQLKAVAAKLGYTDANAMDYHLKKDRPSWEFINKVGRIIHYDFTADFGDMPVSQLVVKEPGSEFYKTMNLNQCREQLDYWMREAYFAQKELADSKQQVLNYMVKYGKL